jgi:hypothetical protein
MLALLYVPDMSLPSEVCCIVERRFATGENRRWISASGLQRRSCPTRGSLPGASARENGTSRTRPRYGPRLALHTRSGHIETDR